MREFNLLNRATIFEQMQVPASRLPFSAENAAWDLAAARAAELVEVVTIGFAW
jgi:hypothetical protein